MRVVTNEVTGCLFSAQAVVNMNGREVSGRLLYVGRAQKRVEAPALDAKVLGGEVWVCPRSGRHGGAFCEGGLFPPLSVARAWQQASFPPARSQEMKRLCPLPVKQAWSANQHWGNSRRLRSF